MQQWIENQYKKYMEADCKIKEVWAAAFIAETGLKPSECQLVKKIDGLTTTYWFEPKKQSLKDFE